jgi:hypothetical protein
MAIKQFGKISAVAAKGAAKGLKTIASLPGRYLDRVEAGMKKADAVKQMKVKKMMKQNFGSVEGYDRLQMKELERSRVKASKKKTQSADYQTEYAKRMGGTATRF